jgi:threonine dehydrogenase-like Zn-dependent dehydrogenase
LIKVPRELRHAGVLMEPTSVAEKAIGQAFEIQRRLRVWQPKRALVLGTGTLGLLATMILRLRGIDVTAMGRTPRPYVNADLLDAIGARYLSTADVSVTGGDRHIEIPADRINQGFVLGNKVMVGSVNASRADFERGVADLAQAELSYPGWLGNLLTHPVKGLENYATLLETLTTGKNAIKVFCEIADLDAR